MLGNTFSNLILSRLVERQNAQANKYGRISASRVGECLRRLHYERYHPDWSEDSLSLRQVLSSEEDYSNHMLLDQYVDQDLMDGIGTILGKGCWTRYYRNIEGAVDVYAIRFPFEADFAKNALIREAQAAIKEAGAVYLPKVGDAGSCYYVFPEFSADISVIIDDYRAKGVPVTAAVESIERRYVESYPLRYDLLIRFDDKVDYDKLLKKVSFLRIDDAEMRSLQGKTVLINYKFLSDARYRWLQESDSMPLSHELQMEFQCVALDEDKALNIGKVDLGMIVYINKDSLEFNGLDSFEYLMTPNAYMREQIEKRLGLYEKIMSDPATPPMFLISEQERRCKYCPFANACSLEQREKIRTATYDINAPFLQDLTLQYRVAEEKRMKQKELLQEMTEEADRLKNVLVFSQQAVAKAVEENQTVVLNKAVVIRNVGYDLEVISENMVKKMYPDIYEAIKAELAGREFKDLLREKYPEVYDIVAKKSSVSYLRIMPYRVKRG